MRLEAQNEHLPPPANVQKSSKLFLCPHNLALFAPIHVDNLPMNMTTKITTRQCQNRHRNSFDRHWFAQRSLKASAMICNLPQITCGENSMHASEYMQQSRIQRLQLNMRLLLP
jgi:hypothetical protein